MLLLNRSELAQVLTMPDAIAAVAEGFREHQLGRSLTPLRMHVEVEPVKGVYLMMPSYLEKSALFGTKVLSVYPLNAEQQKPTINSLYLLNNADDGTFLALMDGYFLTGIRTGAASAVAARELARADACIHGIIGTGGQALYQAEAIAAVRSIRKILVYDRNEQAARAFAGTATQKLGVPVEVLGSAQAVAAQAEILTTVTTSSTPVICRADVRPGCHVNAVGAFKPTMQEINSDLLTGALVVVDTYQGCLHEAGDLVVPIKAGAYRREEIHAELGEILLGAKSGRTSDAQITLFKSVGIAFEDLVVANLAYQRAQERQMGTRVCLTD